MSAIRFALAAALATVAAASAGAAERYSDEFTAEPLNVGWILRKSPNSKGELKAEGAELHLRVEPGKFFLLDRHNFVDGTDADPLVAQVAIRGERASMRTYRPRIYIYWDDQNWVGIGPREYSDRDTMLSAVWRLAGKPGSKEYYGGTVYGSYQWFRIVLTTRRMELQTCQDGLRWWVYQALDRPANAARGAPAKVILGSGWLDPDDARFKQPAFGNDHPDEKDVKLYNEYYDHFLLSNEHRSASGPGIEIPENLSWLEAEAVARRPGSIRQWWILGPFDNQGGRGEATQYPPETGEFDERKTFSGKNNKDISWTKVDFPEEFNGVIDLRKYVEDANYSTAYLYGRFRADATGLYILHMDGAPAVKAWVDGVEVLDRRYYGDVFFPGRHRTGIWLAEGRHSVLMKVSQNYMGWYAQFRAESADIGPRISTLRSLMQACPKDRFHRGEGLLQISRTYEESCDYARALETLDELARELAGDSARLLEARWEQARIYERLGDGAGAAKVLRTAAKEAGADRDAAFMALAEAATGLLDAGLWPEAKAVADELIRDSKQPPRRSADAVRVLFKLHAKRNDSAGQLAALTSLAALVETPSEKAGLRAEAAGIIYEPERARLRNDPKAQADANVAAKALNEWREAFKLSPQAASPRVKEKLALAEEKAARKEFADAVAAFEAAWLRAKLIETCGAEQPFFPEAPIRFSTARGADWSETERKLDAELSAHLWPTDWQAAGPLDNPYGQSMEKSCPPERDGFNAAGFDADGRRIQWTKVDRRQYQNRPDVRLHELYGERKLWAAYLYREFDSPGGPSTLWIGSEDQCVAWLNGKEVLRDLSYGDDRPDARAVRVETAKGKNTLLVKVNQCDPYYGYSNVWCRVSPHSLAALYSARIERLQELHPAERDRVADKWAEAAATLLSQGRAEEAVSLAQSLAGALPDRPEAARAGLSRIGWWCRENGRQAATAAAADAGLDLAARAVLPDPDGARFDFLTMKARALAELGLSAEAEAAWALASRLCMRRGGMAEPMYRRAEALWRARGARSLAVELDEEVVRRYPDDWQWAGVAGAAAAAAAREKTEATGYEISFEAASLISTAERSLDRGEVDRAVALLQQSVESAPGGLYRLGDGRLVGVAEYCRDKMETFKEEGLAAYRRQFDAQAAAALAAALRAGDLGELEACAERYRWSSSSAGALGAAGNVWLDRGRYDRAAGAFERALAMSSSPAADRRMLLAKLAFALGRASRAPEAARALDELLKSYGSTKFVIGGAEVQVRAWATAAREALTASETAGDCDNHATYARDVRRTNMAPGSPKPDKLVWRAPLPCRDLAAGSALAVQPAPYETECSFPSVCGGTVFHSNPWAIQARALADGTLLWRALTVHPERSFSSDDGRYVGITFSSPSVWRGRVYRRVALKGELDGREYLALEARDAATGKLAWSTGALDPSGSLTAVTEPAAAYGMVYAAFHLVEEIDQLQILGFDAETGDCVFRTHVCSGYPGFKEGEGQINFFYHAGAPSVDGSVVYLSTDYGALAAIDAHTGHVLWISQYERAILDAGSGGRQGKIDLAYRGPNSPVVGAELVYIAPRDTMAVMAFNRRTGLPAWRNDLADCRWLVGLDGDTLLVQGRGVQALDAATGSVKWSWRPESGLLPGLGALVHGSMLVPTTEALYRLSTADGRVLARSAWDKPAGWCANLAVSGDRLLGSGPGGVSVYGPEAGRGLLGDTGDSGGAGGAAPAGAPDRSASALSTPLVLSWHLDGGRGIIAQPADRPADRFFAAAGCSLGLWRVSSPPEPVWRVRTGRDIRSMAFSKDIVVARAGNHLEAYERPDGRLRWTWTLPGGRTGYEPRYDDDAASFGNVRVADKVTFVMQRYGVNVIDNATGRTAWGRRSGYPIDADADSEHAYIYSFQESRYNSVSVCDVATGRVERVWQLPYKDGWHPGDLDAARGTFLVKVWNKLALYNLKDFSRKWEIDIGAPIAGNPAGPMVRTQPPYVIVEGHESSDQNKWYFRVYELATGRELFASRSGQLVSADGMLYEMTEPDRGAWRLVCRKMGQAAQAAPQYDVDASISSGWNSSGYTTDARLLLFSAFHAGTRNPDGGEFWRLALSVFDRPSGDFLWSGRVPGTGIGTARWGRCDVPALVAGSLVVYATRDGVWALEGAGAGGDIEKTCQQFAAQAADAGTPRDVRRARTLSVNLHSPSGAQALSSSSPIRADGRLDDWDSRGLGASEPVRLDSAANWRPIADLSGGGCGEWKGPADCSALARFTWDSDRIYIAVEVNDDVASPPPPGAPGWMGDSIRIGIDSQAWRNPQHDMWRGFEFGVSLRGARTEIEQYVGKVVDRSFPERSVEAAAQPKLDGSGVVYEVSIPWELIRPEPSLRPGGESDVGIDVAVYDSDGSGPKGAMEWGAGLVYADSPEFFGRVTFVDLSPARIKDYRQIIDMMSEHPRAWTFLSRILGSYRGIAGLPKIREELAGFLAKHPDSRYAPAAAGYLARGLKLAGSADPLGEAAAFAKSKGAADRELARFRDAKIFQWAYVDPQNIPAMLMLQIHNRRGGDYARPFWGRCTVDWGRSGEPSRMPMGAIPEAGKWVKLEIPAALLDFLEEEVDQIHFTCHGGQVFWGPTILQAPGSSLEIRLEQLPQGWRRSGNPKIVDSPSTGGAKSHTAGPSRGQTSYGVIFEASPFSFALPRPKPSDEERKKEYETIKRAAEIIHDTREGWEFIYWVEENTNGKDYNESVAMRIAYYEEMLAKFPESRNANQMLERIRNYKGNNAEALAYCEGIMRKVSMGRGQRRLFYRGFAPTLTQMLVVGPFDNPEGIRGMSVEYGPEKQLNVAGTYLGKPLPPQEEGAEPRAREVRWEPAKFRKQEGWVDLRTSYGQDDRNVLAYAYFSIDCPKMRTALFLFGADGPVAIWLNGRKVQETTFSQDGKDFQSVEVTLQKGANRVLIKTAPSRYGYWRFFFRIADMNGRPYDDLVPERQEVAKRAYDETMKQYSSGTINAWQARRRLQDVIDSYGETDSAAKAKDALKATRSSRIAKDASGKGNDLEIFGGESAAGLFGKALALNGISDFAEQASAGGPSPTGKEMTIEAFVKLEAEEEVPRTIVNREERYAVQLGSESGAGRSALETAFGCSWSWKGGGNVTLDEWVHVASVFDGSMMKLYVNGKKVAEHDLPDGPPCQAGGEAMRVGARGAPQEPRAFFRGLIDELRISSKARYVADFTPPQAPLAPDGDTLALWHFDEDLPARQEPPQAARAGEAEVSLEPDDGMWLMTSGFSNVDQKGFKSVYLPEKRVNMKARCTLDDGTKSRWRLVKAPDATFDLRTFDERTYIVYYAFAYLRSAADQEVTLCTNSDDGVKVWVNGELVVAEDVYRGVDSEPDKKTRVKLRKGLNPLFVKVTQGDGEAGFRVYVEGAKAEVVRTVKGPVTAVAGSAAPASPSK